MDFLEETVLNLSDTNIPKIKSCRYLCGWIKLHTMMKTEYEKCLAGEPFIGSRDPKIVETILRTRRLLAQFNATDYADTERKQALLREMFGSNVLIASNVQIYTATHSTKVNERIICRTYALPVKIEDGVWIGGGAILLPGVTIGKNSVIGAGSVVTRSIPANCVAVGNPCRVIKQIEGNE